MKDKISNSIIATKKSSIKDAKINVSETDGIDNESSGIVNSVIAEDESIIENVSIDVKKEKRKSFWSGFTFGSIIASLFASAIWFIIQKMIETNISCYP